MIIRKTKRGNLKITMTERQNTLICRCVIRTLGSTRNEHVDLDKEAFEELRQIALAFLATEDL